MATYTSTNCLACVQESMYLPFATTWHWLTIFSLLLYAGSVSADNERSTHHNGTCIHSLAGECPGTCFQWDCVSTRVFLSTYVITTCGPPYIGLLSLSHCHTTWVLRALALIKQPQYIKSCEGGEKTGCWQLLPHVNYGSCSLVTFKF